MRSTRMPWGVGCCSGSRDHLRPDDACLAGTSATFSSRQIRSRISTRSTQTKRGCCAYAVRAEIDGCHALGWLGLNAALLAVASCTCKAAVLQLHPIAYCHARARVRTQAHARTRVSHTPMAHTWTLVSVHGWIVGWQVPRLSEGASHSRSALLQHFRSGCRTHMRRHEW
jgi:hypothetical protein